MSGLGKPFKKIRNKKIGKTEKQSEIAASEQKTICAKPNFCSNFVSSLYFRVKKFHAGKPLAFSLHFLFRCDQNQHSNLTSKMMKMCGQILKKTTPQYNSHSLNYRNLGAL